MREGKGGGGGCRINFVITPCYTGMLHLSAPSVLHQAFFFWQLLFSLAFVQAGETLKWEITAGEKSIPVAKTTTEKKTPTLYLFDFTATLWWQGIRTSDKPEINKHESAEESMMDHCLISWICGLTAWWNTGILVQMETYHNMRHVCLSALSNTYLNINIWMKSW